MVHEAGNIKFCLLCLPNDNHQPTRHRGQNEKADMFVRGRLDEFVKCL
jgi:hypothetical protein